MVTMGAHSYVDSAIELFFQDSGASLTIGKYCSIAQRVTVFLGGNHRMDWITTFPFGSRATAWTKGDVTIGNDVWIGYGVTIMSGVKVGDGAVLAARSVIIRDVPPYALVAGNPAQVKKMRFTEKEIADLVLLRWWDWPDAIVEQAQGVLQGGKVADLVKFAENIKWQC